MPTTKLSVCLCEGDCFHSKLDSYVPVHRGIVQALAGQQSPDQQFVNGDYTHNEYENG